MVRLEEKLKGISDTSSRQYIGTWSEIERMKRTYKITTAQRNMCSAELACMPNDVYVEA
jgi:hypothetical protein